MISDFSALCNMILFIVKIIKSLLNVINIIYFDTSEKIQNTTAEFNTLVTLLLFFSTYVFQRF